MPAPICRARHSDAGPSAVQGLREQTATTADLPSGHLSYQTVAAHPRTRNPLAPERRFTSVAPGPALACPALYERSGQNPPLRHGCHRDPTIIRILVDMQLAAAKSRGLLERRGLPAACDHYAFPFLSRCAILDKESGRTEHLRP